MAHLRRGQPPAWHTKVLHHGPGCLKVGSSYGGLACRNGVASSKPASVGKDATDALQSINVVVLGVKHVNISVLVIGSRAILRIVSIMLVE